jgi:segregation and condensation protein B
MNPDDAAYEEPAVDDPAVDEPTVDGPLPEAPLKAILEALLFASDEPVALEEISGILGEQRAEEISAALDCLEREYASSGGGLRVQRLAGGFRITSDPGLGPFLRELVRGRNRHRLSRAALETLAIVAYKQPITAPEIQEIRGVNPSSILNSLLDRRLVRILGRKKVVGKPFLYGTTRDFLIRFGLNSLDDLPSMEEFTAMLEPELLDSAPERPLEALDPPPHDERALSPENGD